MTNKISKPAEWKNEDPCAFVANSSAEMLGIFEIVALKCSRTEIPIPTPSVIALVYMKVPFRANCVMCNASLKKVQSRKCPHPNEITQYLINNAG